MSRSTYLKLYKILVKPVVKYGREIGHRVPETKKLQRRKIDNFETLNWMVYTRLDKTRNTEMHGKLMVDNIVQDINILRVR
jgi:hypothetical protein